MTKRQRILCIVNKPTREITLFETLENRISIEHKDWKFFTIWWQDPNFLEKVCAFMPSAVITFPMTASGLSWFSYAIKYITKSPVLCYRTEGNINFNSPSQVKWLVGMDKYNDRLVDYEMFWGNESAQIIGSELIHQGKLTSMDRALVVGFLNYEPYLKELTKISRSSGSRNFQKHIRRYSKEKTLLFVTGFHIGDYSKEDLFKAQDCFDLDSGTLAEDVAEALDGVHRAEKFRKLWIDNILSVSKQFSEYLFIVKSHPIEEEIFVHNSAKSPYERLGKQSNICLIKNEMSISDLLPYADKFFHYGSTAQSESYFNNVHTVLIKSRNLYPKIKGHPPSIWDYDDKGWPNDETVDITELTEYMETYTPAKQLPETTDKIKPLLYDLFDITDDNLEGFTPYQPSKKIIKVLEKTASTPVQPLLPHDPHLHVAMHKAEKLGEILYGELRNLIDSDNLEQIYLTATAALRFSLFHKTSPDMIIFKIITKLLTNGSFNSADHLLMQLLMAPNFKEQAFAIWEPSQAELNELFFIGLFGFLSTGSNNELHLDQHNFVALEYIDQLRHNENDLRNHSEQSNLIYDLLFYIAPLLGDQCTNFGISTINQVSADNNFTKLIDYIAFKRALMSIDDDQDIQLLFDNVDNQIANILELVGDLCALGRLSGNSIVKEF